MLWDILRKPYRIEITPHDENWDRWNGYVFDGGSHYVIRVNRNLPIEQQRRTLKHELGHVYGNHLVTPWIDREKAEQQANDAADNMTDEMLKQLLNLAIRIDFL